MPRWASPAGALLGVAAFVATLSAGPAAAQTGAEALRRMDAYEAELRRLTAQVERLEFERRQLTEALEALLREHEYRLIELEGGDPTEALTGPPLLGGDGLASDNPAPQAEDAPAPLDSPQEGATTAADAPPDEPTSGPGPGAPPAPLGPLSEVPPSAEQAAFDAARRTLDGVGLTAGREAFDAFMADYPASPLGGEALYRLGRAYADAGRYEEAARLHLRGLREHAADPYAETNLLGLAEALDALGRDGQACAAFTEFANRHRDAATRLLVQAEAGRERTCR
jgi:TolA-binding protein